MTASRPIETLSSPTPREAGDTIVNAMTADKVVIVCCQCDVDYDGRAGGYLPTGNRTIIIKPDGTFLVTGSDKVKPRNWQPSGATCSVEVDGDTLVLESERTSPERERLIVYCDPVYEVIAYDAGDDPDVTLTGTEEDMHERIMTEPDLVEEGFRPLEHERSVKFGSIDVFGNDNNGNPVIIEVKRRHAQLKDVDQLARYMSLYRAGEADDDHDVDDLHDQARGILVAPSASDSVKAALDDKELEFVALEPAKTLDEQGQSSKLTDF